MDPCKIMEASDPSFREEMEMYRQLDLDRMARRMEESVARVECSALLLL